jgi:hypothetical protein
MLLACNGLFSYAQNLDKLGSMPKFEERKDAIKINLLSPFYSTISLSYQHVLSNTGSFNLTMSYMDFDSYGSTQNPSTSYNSNYIGGYSTYRSIQSQRTQGFAITPEYRYLINGKGLTGLYLAPFFRYMYYEYSQYYTSNNYNLAQGNYVYNVKGFDLYSYNSIGFGCVIGKQIIFKNKITMDLFVGPSYSILAASNRQVRNNDDIVVGPGIPNVYLRGYSVRGGFTVGYAF